MHMVRYALLIAAVVAPAVQADCAFVEHTVTGTVVANDQPVAGAIVEAEWVEKKAGIASTRAKTDEVGRYVLTITFDPYSARSFGGKESCESRLEEVIVRVRAAGRDPYEKRVAITEQAEDVNLALR